PRHEVMRHLIPDRLALIVSRQSNASNWANVHIATGVVDHCLVSNRTSEIGSVFPLWLYPREQADLLDDAPREKADLLDEAPREKTANLAPEFVAALSEAVGHEPTPEDTLAYIYALLYAPSYRQRYADFLKRDFPRVPLTTDRKLFAKLVETGRELIALHTMQTALPSITGFPVAGTNQVGKVRFALPSPGGRGVGGEGPESAQHSKSAEPSSDSSACLPPKGEGTPPQPSPARGGSEGGGRVYINAEQYFEGVPQAVWDLHIGGYRVAEKWLKDRKDRALSYDDLTHYQNVVAALARTLELQSELDAAIEKAGGWPIT
ncbi:MAG TPA: type ISP restriction/modification enzyme, partial [Gammaproteobacteria bacterium]|nr:type ISP restriction/modification enzyme [Gammaproteobacteria bacterium]